MYELSEFEHDAMLEVINISIGSAANILSSLVEDEVTLFVPSFEFFSRKQAIENVGELAHESICAVSQHIEEFEGGGFRSDAILIFSEQRAMQLVQLTMGEAFDSAIPIADFSEMQQEAMTEIGNIVLNACIGAIGNLFNIEFTISLPSYQLTSYQALFDDSRIQGSDDEEIIMLLLINFKLSKSAIQGHLAFKMGLPAFEDFKGYVKHLLDSYGSD